MPQARWDTGGLPARELLAHWRTVVGEALLPVDVTIPIGSGTNGEGAGFSGTIRAHRVGPLQVALIESHAQSMARTRRHVEVARRNAYFLSLPLTDGMRACQDGRHAEPGSGDLVLLDADTPFSLEFAGAFRLIVLTVPHDSLAAIRTGGGQTAVTIAGTTGVGGVAAAAIRALARDGAGIHGRVGVQVAEQVVALFGLAVRQPAGREGRRLRDLEAARAVAERSLADPDLTPARVAARMGISVRYLHQLFSDTEVSFSRWLRDRRLELCHRALTDPAFAGCTIAEIAASHGLPDPAHFARVFKARFGHPASELRRVPCAGSPGPMPSPRRPHEASQAGYVRP